MKLPNAITKVVARQTALLAKNSPSIMFSVGVAGAITSTVLACKATLKLEEVMLKHEESRRTADYLHGQKLEDYTPQDYNRDNHYIRARIAQDMVKLYGPAVALGVVSIGLLTGAHVTLNRRNAALIAAYNLIDKGFKEYRERVRAEYGDDKDREFLFGSVEKEIVEEGEHGHEVKVIKRVAGHSRYARPFDENNQCWSNNALTNRHFLMAQQNYLNDLLHSRGHVLLNDAYDLLKMERSVAGSVVGWVEGHGDNMIDFGLFHSNDPVIRDFMNLEHNNGIMIDFNVDGVINDLIGKKY